MSIKVKRGLAINLPTLEEGELGFTTDSYEMYVGSDNGNILLNNGEILIRRNNGMLQYAQSNRKNQWFDICSLEEIRGDQGIQGIQGIQGVKGDKGDKGERGIQGEKGNPFTYADFTPDQLRALKGEKGDTGAKGERGLTGDKGDRGIGLNYAWSGTRLGVKRDTDAQYTYVDLKGADGKDGEQGERGERGERGIQGEKGETPSIAHLEKQVSDKSKELDTKFNTLTAKQQQDAEVVTARDGEVSLHARLERDLAKGKIHFVDVEGSSISTESEEGYLENIEIHGNTWQDANNLSDIRSVGTKVEGQELYEIDVVSCGKNLFNGKFELGGIYIVDGTNTPSSTSVRTDFIKVPIPCTFSRKKDKDFLGFRLYDKNKKFISSASENGLLYTIRDNNVSYVRFVSIDGITNNEYMIEEGTQATPYEPYQEDKLTILSPTPLEKVGDVADRIICKDGVWGVEKNIENRTLDDSIVWGNYSTQLPNTYIMYTNSLNSLPYQHTNVICNKVPTTTDIINADEDACKFSNSIEKSLWIRLSRSKGITNDIEFKNYIINNNFVVKYVSYKPQFIPLPHDQQIKLRTFADRTHISFGTEIQPTIKAQVPKSLGATVNTHTTQIDNLNKELDRVKKLEESTVSTVTSCKAFTTVSETTQGYFEDVKVEGKTLVNLFDKNTRTITPSEYNYKHLAGGMIRKPIEGNIYTVWVTDERIKYTLAYLDNNGAEFSIRAISKAGAGTFVCPPNVARILVYCVDNYDLTSPITLGTILLEGDHTDKDISYFEGLKSVGQDRDEISVLSVNENLFTIDSNQFYNNNLSSFECILNDNAIRVRTSPICMVQGKYTLSGLNNNIVIAGIRAYDINKNSLENSVKLSGNLFELPYNCKYIHVLFKKQNDGEINRNEVANLNISITRGSVSSQYKSPEQDKKQILYYNPNTQIWEKPVLREWDSIEKHSNGKYYYHKRSGEVVLNGSEGGWKLHSADGNRTTIGMELRIESKFNEQDSKVIDIICDKLACITADDSYGKDLVGVASRHDLIRLRLDPSVVGGNDVPSMKNWLQANPATVVYQLAKEEVYECTNLDLITYNGETNLIVSSGAIQPKVTLKVLSNVSNVVKLLQEKVSILENKFIKGLKQVLAGDMMSLAHLLYPEDFTLENDTPQVIPYIEEGDINE